MGLCRCVRWEVRGGAVHLTSLCPIYPLLVASRPRPAAVHLTPPQPIFPPLTGARSALGSAAKDLESWDGPSVSAMLASSAIVDGGNAAAAAGVGCDKSSWEGDSASIKSSAMLHAFAGGIDPVSAATPPTPAECKR